MIIYLGIDNKTVSILTFRRGEETNLALDHQAAADAEQVVAVALITTQAKQLNIQVAQTDGTHSSDTRREVEDTQIQNGPRVTRVRVEHSSGQPTSIRCWSGGTVRPASFMVHAPRSERNSLPRPSCQHLRRRRTMSW